MACGTIIPLSDKDDLVPNLNLVTPGALDHDGMNDENATLICTSLDVLGCSQHLGHLLRGETLDACSLARNRPLLAVLCADEVAATVNCSKIVWPAEFLRLVCSHTLLHTYYYLLSFSGRKRLRNRDPCVEARKRPSRQPPCVHRASV